MKNGVHTHCIKHKWFWVVFERIKKKKTKKKNCSGWEKISLLWSLCSISGQASERPKCDVCQLSSHKSPPWQPVVETDMWLFAKSKQLHNPRLTLRQNVFTVKTRHLDHHYCTHANVSGRNHFVCLACSLYMFCAAPPNPPVIDAHTHTLLLLSPWCFSSVNHLFCFGLEDQDLCRETPTLTLQRHDTGCQCGVSQSCSFYLYGQSCFHHLGHHLSSAKQRPTFPSTANLE